MSESTIQLDYAKPPRWHRRRVFRRAAIAIALLAIVGSARRWGPEKWQRAQLLYWQWRCLNYSPPADEIVFDQEPNGRSALLKGSSKYVAQVEDAFAQNPTTAAVTVPDCANRFEHLIPPDQADGQPPIVFMHDRAAPSGRHYLIILRGDFAPFLQIEGLPMYFDAFSIGNWQQIPWNMTGGRFWSGPVSLPVQDRIRIYAGQADPADPTHFTIRYVVNGKTAVIDGYVGDYQWGQNLALAPTFIATVKLVPRPAHLCSASHAH